MLELFHGRYLSSHQIIMHAHALHTDYILQITHKQKCIWCVFCCGKYVLHHKKAKRLTLWSNVGFQQYSCTKKSYGDIE